MMDNKCQKAVFYPRQAPLTGSEISWLFEILGIERLGEVCELETRPQWTGNAAKLNALDH